jgi:hypothetical protein
MICLINDQRKQNPYKPQTIRAGAHDRQTARLDILGPNVSLMMHCTKAAMKSPKIAGARYLGRERSQKVLP